MRLVAICALVIFMCGIGCQARRSAPERDTMSQRQNEPEKGANEDSNTFAIRIFSRGIERGRVDRKASVDVQTDMSLDRPTALLYILMHEPVLGEQVEALPKELQEIYLDVFVAGYKAGHALQNRK